MIRQINSEEYLNIIADPAFNGAHDPYLSLFLKNNILSMYFKYSTRLQSFFIKFIILSIRIPHILYAKYSTTMGGSKISYKTNHYHSNVTCIACISIIAIIWMVNIDIVSDPDTESTSATRTDIC